MNFKRIVIIVVITCISWLIYQGFLIQQRRSKLNTEALVLHLNHQGLEDFHKYAYGKATSHPTGMSFHEIDWRPPQLGRVKIKTKRSNLEIPNVFRVMGSTGGDMMEGIQSIAVHSSLHHEEYVSHEKAYEGYIRFMQELNRKGWEQYFSETAARIAKESNWKHIREYSGDVIDPTYILSYDEWSQIKLLFFNLHLGEIKLGISLKRTFGDENKVQYMVRYTFRRLEFDAFNDGYSDGLSLDQIKQAYRNKLSRYSEIRKKSEEKAIENGYTIDYDYKDYMIFQDSNEEL